MHNQLLTWFSVKFVKLEVVFWRSFLLAGSSAQKPYGKLTSITLIITLIFLMIFPIVFLKSPWPLWLKITWHPLLKWVRFTSPSKNLSVRFTMPGQTQVQICLTRHSVTPIWELDKCPFGNCGVYFEGQLLNIITSFTLLSQSSEAYFELS